VYIYLTHEDACFYTFTLFLENITAKYDVDSRTTVYIISGKVDIVEVNKLNVMKGWSHSEPS
jgi:hypothetical protein